MMGTNKDKETDDFVWIINIIQRWKNVDNRTIEISVKVSERIPFQKGALCKQSLKNRK